MQGKLTTDCNGPVRHRKWQEPAGTLLMALTAYNASCRRDLISTVVSQRQSVPSRARFGWSCRKQGHVSCWPCAVVVNRQKRWRRTLSSKRAVHSLECDKCWEKLTDEKVVRIFRIRKMKFPFVGKAVKREKKSSSLLFVVNMQKINQNWPTLCLNWCLNHFMLSGRIFSQMLQPKNCFF